MRYISLSYLQDFLGYASEELLFENKSQHIEKVVANYAAGKTFSQEGLVFTEQEVKQFVLGLTDKKQLVFDQWILASKSLKILLFEGKLLKNDINDNLKEHFLFKDFSQFVSPFLFPKLIHFLEKGDSELFISSFIRLLDSDSKWILQDKLAKNLRLKYQRLSSTESKTLSQEEFNLESKRIFQDDQLEALNYFTKEFYVEKVNFVEMALALFTHPHATYGFAFWLSKQVLKLKLNPEHEEKIHSVFKSLKEGDGHYYKAKHKINTWSLGKVITLLLIPLTIGALIWLFTWQFSNSKEKLSTNKGSSFTQFSKKERMQLDSLIQSMSGKKQDPENMMQENKSYLHLAPVEISIDQVEALTNQQAENYIQSCLKAYELSEQNKIQSCSPYSEKEFQIIQDKFSDLTINKGEHSFLLKNESEYQVQVLVFDTLSNAKVYAHYINLNETLKFKVKTGQKIIFIPGNNLGKAIFPSEVHLSPLYQHHFCFMDGSFISNLLHAYRINTISENEIKVLLNNDEENGFYLLDIYQGLSD